MQQFNKIFLLVYALHSTYFIHVALLSLRIIRYKTTSSLLFSMVFFTYKNFKFSQLYLWLFKN